MNTAKASYAPGYDPVALRRQSELRQQIGLTISMLGRDVLAFHPKLARVTGSIPSGLMLSQSIYWERILLERNDREGWFWKTHLDWQREIALSKHEQITARRRLTALPFWQEERRATHGRMHYRVDLNALARHIDQDFTGSWWNDRQQMLLLLGRPLLVFRPLADLCGSVTAAILLSHFLGVERHELRISQGGSQKEWHVHQFDALKQQTGLSRAELNHARKTLRDLGYLKERLIGAPPRSEWRITFPDLIRDLRASVEHRSKTALAPKNNADRISTPAKTPVVDQYASFQQTRLLETSILKIKDIQGNEELGDFAEKDSQHVVFNKLSGIRTTEDTESVQQKIRNPENMMYGIKKVCCTDSGFPNIGLTTGKPITTTTSPTPPAPVVAKAEPALGGGGSSSIKPNDHCDRRHP